MKKILGMEMNQTISNDEDNVIVEVVVIVVIINAEDDDVDFLHLKVLPRYISSCRLLLKNLSLCHASENYFNPPLNLASKKQKLQSNDQIEAKIEKKKKQSREMKSPSRGDVISTLGRFLKKKKHPDLTKPKKKFNVHFFFYFTASFLFGSFLLSINDIFFRYLTRRKVID